MGEIFDQRLRLIACAIHSWPLVAAGIQTVRISRAPAVFHARDNAAALWALHEGCLEFATAERPPATQITASDDL